MKKTMPFVALALVASTIWVLGQSAAPAASDPLVDGFRLVEVASVADAAEQLYGQRVYMSHEMRPLTPTKFSGPAVTVQLIAGVSPV